MMENIGREYRKFLKFYLANLLVIFFKRPIYSKLNADSEYVMLMILE
jgi:hypothetical protein